MIYYYKKANVSIYFAFAISDEASAITRYEQKKFLEEFLGD